MRLNDAMRILGGEMPPLDGCRFDVVVEVSEPIWEPIAEPDG